MTHRCLIFSVLLSGAMLCANAQDKNENDYIRQPLPETWTYVSDYEQNGALDNDWWRVFCDSMLDSLISIGRENNYDVLAAIKRIEGARAQVGIARAAYYPTVGVTAGWQRQRSSGMTVNPHGTATTVEFFNLGADVNWQIDIFGKIAQGVKQKKAQWRASKAQYDGVMVSIESEIAANYINYRIAQAELAVAREHSESQLRIVKIAEARHETGLASALDVAQAQTVYYSTISTIPPLENEMHAYLNAIACLLGVYADNLPQSILGTGAWPNYETVVTAGVPAELLRRRPDILEAEANIAAAAAAVGIAKRDFLPTLSISGTIGTQAHRLNDMFKNQSIGYTVAPTLSWTVFNGLERKYALSAAKANCEALIDEYNLTVMNAVVECDNALFAYQSNMKAISSIYQAMDEAHRSLKLSLDLYKSGNASFTNVSDAQISFLTYTNQLIAAKGNAALSLVNLYKALGGGWQAS